MRGNKYKSPDDGAANPNPPRRWTESWREPEGHPTDTHMRALREKKENHAVKNNQTIDRGDFWASPVEILVFASPTGYMLTSTGYTLLN